MDVHGAVHVAADITQVLTMPDVSDPVASIGKMAKEYGLQPMFYGGPVWPGWMDAMTTGRITFGLWWGRLFHRAVLDICALFARLKDIDWIGIRAVLP